MIPYIENYNEFLREFEALLNKYDLGFMSDDDSLVFYKLKNEFKILTSVNFGDDHHVRGWFHLQDESYLMTGEPGYPRIE